MSSAALHLDDQCAILCGWRGDSGKNGLPGLSWINTVADSIQEVQELINPGLKVLGVIATLYDTRVTDDREILELLKKEYNLLGVIKRLAVAKKGIYDGRAAVEQAPNSEIAKEYTAIANWLIEKQKEDLGNE